VDQRHLRILRELGELGSVRAVAEALHLTPSAVSQQLRSLQRGVGVPLTERRGRRLALTDAGHRLAAAAAEVETALARAHDVARDLSGEPAGTVTVSAFTSAAMAFFAPLVQRSRQRPGVRVILTDEDVAQSEFVPLTSTYDVVLAHRFEHTREWPATVIAVSLLEEPLDIALPRGHPLAGAAEVRAAEAACEPWITTHPGFPVGVIVDSLAAVAGRPVEIVHRVNEFTVAAELVRAGAGVALLPRWTTPPPRGVVLRPLGGVRSRRSIDALVRPEKAQRPAVRSVLGSLSAIAAELASTPT
jgi:DNA-binding transcriptional LysR family regulator